MAMWPSSRRPNTETKLLTPRPLTVGEGAMAALLKTLEICHPTADMLLPQNDNPIARWSGKDLWGHYQVTKLVARRRHTGTLHTVCGNVQRRMHMAKEDPPDLAMPG